MLREKIQNVKKYVEEHKKEIAIGSLSLAGLFITLEVKRHDELIREIVKVLERQKNYNELIAVSDRLTTDILMNDHAISLADLERKVAFLMEQQK